MRWLIPASSCLALACGYKSVDNDGDGYTSYVDCDDNDPKQGFLEIPYDGIDNDCDNATDCDDPALARRYSHHLWQPVSAGQLTRAPPSVAA